MGDQLGQKEEQLHDVERQLSTLKATAEKYARVSFIHLFIHSFINSSQRLSGFQSGDNSTVSLHGVDVYEGYFSCQRNRKS